LRHLVVRRNFSGNLTAEQDWLNRSTAPGVVKAQDFRTSSSVTNFIHHNTDQTQVTLDTTNKITGNGSLKIASPASIGQNGAAWRAPLNDSWTTDGQGFGTSQTWYVSFQVYHAPNRLTCGSTGDGFKILNIAEYRFSSPDSSMSHPTGEIVLSTRASSANIPVLYRDNGNGTPGFDAPFGGGGNILYQPAVDNGAALPNDQRYCLWTGSGDTFAGCVKWPVGEWFEVRLEIKTASTSTGNYIKCSFKRFGQAEQTMWNEHDWSYAFDSLIPNGPNGIWFQTFDTNRTSATEDTYTNYTQLIVSTQPIAARQA
jgi:hypothetical protein